MRRLWVRQENDVDQAEAVTMPLGQLEQQLRRLSTAVGLGLLVVSGFLVYAGMQRLTLGSY